MDGGDDDVGEIFNYQSNIDVANSTGEILEFVCWFVPDGAEKVGAEVLLVANSKDWIPLRRPKG
jgi:hypothetical protein